MEYTAEQRKLIQKFLFRHGYMWRGTFVTDKKTGEQCVELVKKGETLSAQLYIADLEFKIYQKELYPGKSIITTIADLSKEWVRYQAKGSAKRANELLEIADGEKAEILANIEQRKLYGNRYDSLDVSDREKIKTLDKARRIIKTRGFM